MNSNLFIPKKINVGFQKRSDTYTGKLAYVIYYDEKGKLRKQASWESWRDENIPSQEFKNEPIEGFVLNKKVGGYKSGWDFRHSYIRVYDPRGFEFEITIENLLYILENCNCFKGKGIEGKLIYSWNGTDLVLLPVNSSDYEEITKYNEKLINKEKITNTTLKIGYTYRKKNNETLVFLGKYDWYDYSGINSGLRYIFADLNKDVYQSFYIEEMVSANGKFIEIISDTPINNLEEILELLQHNKHISPENKESVDVPITLEQYVNNEYRNKLVCYINDIKYDIDSYHLPDGNWLDIRNLEPNQLLEIGFSESSKRYDWKYRNKNYETLTINELFNKYNIFVENKYLQNGKLYFDGINCKHIF